MAKYILVKENMEQQTDDNDIKNDLMEQGYVLADRMVKNKETLSVETINLKLNKTLEGSQARILELEKQVSTIEAINKELNQALEESQNKNTDLEKQLKESKAETTEPAENKKK